MPTNNEIEFKQLLTATQYDNLTHFYFKNETPFSQTNHYIDTPDFQLKAQRCALRIRVKDQHNEMTLKVPAAVGLLEYNFDTTVQPEINAPLPPSQLPQDIKDVLSQMHIDIESLVILGSLTTERLEREIDNNLLVLDKSTYLNTTDYELEYEVQEYNSGLAQFHALLAEHDIDAVTPDNKVQRFFNRKEELQ
ncbi:CYTH domain-containing protein [Staphylococcus arlettae]|uniref:CYTH domain-containing protein n=1 Tax=Staphylococcus arlettae TaxID=29378 RepID=UPI001E473DCF|nr:CYTH domain-containing protein [Staphylococcus arlettae]MCD8890103.1 CYTH domain-containing protein [Staphylococcus arlettae]